MSRKTTNYGYNISEGTDLVNPLVDIFPNWEAIDGDLKDVSDDAVGRATELTTGTVHALTRSDAGRDVFVFTATSNFTAGDTFTLDGTQVSALTPAGEQLATGCYIIGSDVLVAVHGTLMTMYVSPTKVADSDKLDGHDSTYFATASGVSDLSDDLDAVSDKVGTGVLTTTAQNCVGAINELNSDLTVQRFSDKWSKVGRLAICTCVINVPSQTPANTEINSVPSGYAPNDIIDMFIPLILYGTTNTFVAWLRINTDGKIYYMGNNFDGGGTSPVGNYYGYINMSYITAS